MRRGIVEHLISRRITTTEYAVLTTLILLADKSTGKGTINVPTLRHFHPDLSADTADRVLRSLQKKRLIYRQIIYKSLVAYPYSVHGYEVTFGARKGLRLDLSQVFETKSISKLRYIDPADDPADQPADDAADRGADDPADSNEKDTRKEKRDKEIPPSLLSESASLDTSNLIHETGQESAIAQPMSPARRVPPASEANVECVHTAVTPSSGAGLRWGGSQDIGYLDSVTGTPVDYCEALRRITDKVGLFWEDGEFLDARGHRVSWDAAQAQISGLRRQG